MEGWNSFYDDSQARTALQRHPCFSDFSCLRRKSTIPRNKQESLLPLRKVDQAKRFLYKKYKNNALKML